MKIELKFLIVLKRKRSEVLWKYFVIEKENFSKIFQSNFFPFFSFLNLYIYLLYFRELVMCVRVVCVCACERCSLNFIWFYILLLFASYKPVTGFFCINFRKPVFFLICEKKSVVQYLWFIKNAIK